ncbi:ABC transporter ATP-binding protein [Patescibacteria group bacterium]|nr:ABC transporter ATP-binding protein [Patescibacteria group bacterium]MBU1890563.1 ABC transporter ATP-binding protein [Patescibacteria group bacterium]
MKVIELEGIRKVYEARKGNQTNALQGVDLTIEEGDFVAVMGPSGSGKSTLLHIIGLLDKKYSGEYRLNDKSVINLSENKRADLRNEEIGFVFQRFNLLKRTTVINNILLPTVYRKTKDDLKRALRLIEKVGLNDKAEHRSNELSGGEVQRVAIARALIKDPTILLADEPTGNIDSKTACIIMDLIKKINEEGTTVILITHEENVAKYAKRIIRILDGKIIKDETP